MATSFIEPEILVTDRELARRWNIGVRTVFSLRKEGLPCVRIGRSVRYCPIQATEWLRNREQSIEQ